MQYVKRDLDSEKRHSIFNLKYRYQLLATITVQFFSFAHGIGIGWVSPTLHKLQSMDSPTNFSITVEQVSWIGSLFGLGALIGNILFGVLLNRIGRKSCLYLMALPYMCSWFLVYFSKTYVYLYTARFLSGMAGGGMYVVGPIFVSEISDPSIRGALSSMGTMFLSFGILAGFVLSSYIDYYLTPCIILILPIIYLIAVTQFPETPQYLLSKQQINKACEAFKFYKRFAKPEEISRFEILKISVLNDNGKLEKLKIQDFVNPEALKTFSTAFILMALNPFSGAFPFLNYMSDVFAQTGTNIDPNLCTIVMGVAQIVGTCLTMILVDRFGRKLLMLTSAAGMGLGLFTFGFYMQFTTLEQKMQYNWLPLVIMIFVILIASIGILSLVFTIIVEILPSRIRAVGSSICMAVMSVMIFLALKIFPILLHKYSLATVVFSCGGVCVIGWFYLLLCLRETKGQALDK